jgi:hypothetical protein
MNEGIIMKYRDGIFSTVALALTSFALAGVVYTDVYSQAAKAEVSGVRALTEVASGDVLACADTATLAAEPVGTLDAAQLNRTVRQ